jgi:hypothetical protein
MVGSAVGTLSFSFDVDFSFASTNNTRLVTGSVGSDLSAQTWMSYGIDSTGAANIWRVTGSTNTFSGAQTLTFVMNDSGSAVTYTAPGGGAETVALGAYDLWVGNTKVFNDRISGVNTSYDLKQFGMTVANLNGGAGTFAFDNFNAQAIPEPATLGMLGFAGGAILLIRRRLMK